MRRGGGINNILIVDDSKTARMILKQCIEISGFRDRTFIEARNGEEAWQMLQDQKVDMIITDLTMPELDGCALLQRIKATPALVSISVIVVTSASNPARDAELIGLGAAAVLAKPVSPALVYKTLSLFMKNERERTAR
jgi:two-component system chemotaxis response regulator CheY